MWGSHLPSTIRRKGLHTLLEMRKISKRDLALQMTPQNEIFIGIFSHNLSIH